MENTYDARFGKAVQQRQADGGIWSFTYTLMGIGLGFCPIKAIIGPASATNVSATEGGGDLFGKTAAVVQAQQGGGVLPVRCLEALQLINSNNPVIEATATDPLGNQTTYRFTPQGALGAVTDALGRTTEFVLEPESNQLLLSGTPQARVKNASPTTQMAMC